MVYVVLLVDGGGGGGGEGGGQGGGWVLAEGPGQQHQVRGSPRALRNHHYQTEVLVDLTEGGHKVLVMDSVESKQHILPT